MPSQTLDSTTVNGQQQGQAEKRVKKNRGNFANNRERARIAGQKGGRARGKSRLHQ